MKTFKRFQEQSYDYLKKQIFTGELQENVYYSESKLAAELGISRTPIRDALQRLGQEGFIDIYPSIGFKLHTMTPEDLIDTYQLRSAIEVYCTHLIASEYKTPRAQALLADLNAQLEKQMHIFHTTADTATFTDSDQLFHTLIVGYANNKTFNSIYDNNLYRIRSFIINSFKIETRMEEAINEHKEIYNALSMGDLKNISTVTLEHLNRLKEISLKIISDENVTN